jgi:hypothetical protein
MWWNRLFDHRDLGHGVLEEHGRIKNFASLLSLEECHILQSGAPFAGGVGIVFEMSVVREFDKHIFYIQIGVV